MLATMLLMIVIVSVLVSLLLLEKYLISRSVRAIPYRVHVNGTRGKSSVTKYIASGLRDENKEIMSKVTGVKPLLYHNGIESEVRRRGMPRVQEQFGVIRKASSKSIHSLVLECMSISPELQRLESRIFEPHIYVITNIKDDHREVMGQNISDQVKSICSAIPANCTVVTTENTYLADIREYAARVGSRVVVPDRPDRKLLENMPGGVFSENISLALEVCKLSGEDNELARNRIFESFQDDEPASRIVAGSGREIYFLNAFSANDVESTKTIIEQWIIGSGYKGKLNVLLNTRADRPLRTEAFTDWLAGKSSNIDKVIITGSHSIRARTKLIRSGMAGNKILLRRVGQIAKEELLRVVSNESLVVGVGNIGKEGHRIIEELK